VTRSANRLPPGVPLFVATTFASAFLIFLVQPLVAKRILPWFGGVPAVWSLCLAFYQTTLFAGYAYAYLLIARASPRQQLALHAGVVALAVLALPVLPGDAWQPEGSGDPSARILAMLLANVGLPFFALAATGPLVAAWFSRRYPARSPYPLYAVSNLGSLIALLAYPFALEPRLPLSATGQFWSGAFAATGGAVIACAFLARREVVASVTGPADANVGPEQTPVHTALWVLLSACAVMLLMGITNHLCLDVASVPFLWILPLALYLASLIVCFGAPRVYRRIPFALLAMFCYFAGPILMFLGASNAVVAAFGGKLPFEVTRYGMLLFAACMVLHGELYRLRPPARSLTAFYLCTSGGGALGGLAVGLVAPRVFNGFYEFPIGLALAAALLLVAWRRDPAGWLARGAPRWRLGAVLAVAGAAMVALGWQTFARPENLLHQERSFFGVLRVHEILGSRWRTRILVHGTTLHGLQIEGHENTPTAYFGPRTGIEAAMSLREPDVPVDIGVVGLGAGTLAAYGRAGDRFRFFEIDPAVIRIARDAGYFRFLARSAAQVEIVEGDGRIALARERARNAPRFDYLIIDAYSGDAVPVHLLTREAIALYADAIRPDGYLVFHVSARYLDLVPIIFQLADDAQLFAVSLENGRFPRLLTNPAIWVFVSRSEARIRAIAEAPEPGGTALRRTVVWPTRERIASAPLWTDDYSNLLRVLRRQPTSYDGPPTKETSP
jgi:SAM-dependent methyltransferase